jgi:uncharacterized protein with PQ loop repeat
VDISVTAGAIATVVFASSTLPMLAKAWRTKDVSSYSAGNIVLANIGNVLYAVYVVNLPIGPIWALHAFHTLSTGLMLHWYIRYVVLARRPALPHQRSTESAGALTQRASVLTMRRRARSTWSSV